MTFYAPNPFKPSEWKDPITATKDTFESSWEGSMFNSANKQQQQQGSVAGNTYNITNTAAPTSSTDTASQDAISSARSSYLAKQALLSKQSGTIKTSGLGVSGSPSLLKGTLGG